MIVKDWIFFTKNLILFVGGKTEVSQVMIGNSTVLNNCQLKFLQFPMALGHMRLLSMIFFQHSHIISLSMIFSGRKLNGKIVNALLTAMW